MAKEIKVMKTEIKGFTITTTTVRNMHDTITRDPDQSIWFGSLSRTRSQAIMAHMSAIHRVLNELEIDGNYEEYKISADKIERIKA